MSLKNTGKISGLLLLACILFSNLLSSQSYVSEEDKDFFLKRKTLFIIDPAEDYSKWLKSAVEQYWKLTEYIFIKPEEQDKYKEDLQYAFFGPITSTLGYSSGAYSSNYVEYYHRRDIKKTETGNVQLACYYYYRDAKKNKLQRTYATKCCIGFEILDFGNYPTKKLDTELKVITMIRLMQDIFNPSIKEEVGKKSEAYDRGYFKIIKNKTLLIQKEQLAEDVKTLEEIAKYYSGKVKFSNEKEMIEKVKEKNKEYVYVLFSKPDQITSNPNSPIKDRVISFKVIDCETGTCLYNEIHSKGYFTKKHFTIIEKLKKYY